MTIIKDDKGTGIQLSVGLPPFTVTYVEPGIIIYMSLITNMH